MAVHEKMPSLKSTVSGGNLQHEARDLLGLGDHLVGGVEDRRHADRARARAVGAHAELHLVGIAVHDGDLLDGDAELLRHELGEGGLVALAVAVRAGEHLDRAGRIDAHFRGLPQADAGAERADRGARRDAAGLDVGGEADAALHALLGALRLAGGEARVVGKLQRLAHGGVVVAGIVGHDDGRLVRERGDEVLAAELGRVAAGLACRHLHQALDHEGGLRPAGAAVGVDRRGVGVDAVHLAVDRGDIVLARQQRRVEIGRHRRGEGGEIAAEVGLGLGPERQDLAVGVERQLGSGHVVAAVGIGEEGFACGRRST